MSRGSPQTSGIRVGGTQGRGHRLTWGLGISNALIGRGGAWFRQDLERQNLGLSSPQSWADVGDQTSLYTAVELRKTPTIRRQLTNSLQLKMQIPWTHTSMSGGYLKINIST